MRDPARSHFQKQNKSLSVTSGSSSAIQQLDEAPAHWLEASGCLPALGLWVSRFFWSFSICFFALTAGLFLGILLEDSGQPWSTFSIPVMILFGPWSLVVAFSVTAVRSKRKSGGSWSDWGSHNWFLRLVFPVTCHRVRHRLLATIKQRELEETSLVERNRQQHTGEIYFHDGGPARTPLDADDFEEVCAEFMRLAGFSDARRTPKGPDGGADILSADAIGQAKFLTNAKVGSEVIQRLEGARAQFGKQHALCFSWGSGYTEQALRTATQLGVVCFKFDPRRAGGQGFRRES